MARKKTTRVNKKRDVKLKLESKDESMKQYKKYDESNAKKFYLQILSELEKSVSTGNISDLKYVSSIIDNINGIEDQATLKKFHEDSNNPLKNTNLLILACKHNQPGILKHVLYDDKTILENLSYHKGCNISPDDEDETSHNAFYYAMRSGNIELFEILADWTENVSKVDLNKLDEMLSKAYGELKLRNVPLTEKMEVSVEYKLLNRRFYSCDSKQNQNIANILDNIKERIKLVLQNIKLLVKEHSNAEVDDTFLFLTKFIAQNIHVLKRQLKCTYDRLPWEEMEFFLICFISSHTKLQEINLFYHATLDKRQILLYLEIFAVKLEEMVVSIKEMSKLAVIPKLKREEVVTKIIENDPQFKEFYNNYYQIRDFYSIEKIGNYISLALSVDPDKKEGKIILIRVLQLIGECLKNTLESPKLSNLTSDLLLLSLSKNTRKIIADLRNSLSHAASLLKRTEIEENSNVKFFSGVQNDLKKLGYSIIYVLYNSRIKIIRILLEKIVDSENVDEIIETAKVLKNVEISKKVFDDFRMMELEKLERLSEQLSSNITDMTAFEKRLFSKIDYLIKLQNSKLKNIREVYTQAFSSLLINLQSLSSYKDIDHNTIRLIKFQAKETLKRASPRTEGHSIKEIAELSMKIFLSLSSRNSSESLDERYDLFHEIFFLAQFQIFDIRWIEKLKSKLNESSPFISLQKQSKTYDAKEVNASRLTIKLSELKSALRNNLLSNETIQEYSSYKCNKKLQAVIEMLLLDVMSILEILNYLENNQIFLDDNYPLLIGKSLRNHLAHNNALFDILLSNPCTAIFLNAKKLTEEEAIMPEQKIGKIINDDPPKLNEKLSLNLKNLNIKDKCSLLWKREIFNF